MRPPVDTNITNQTPMRVLVVLHMRNMLGGLLVENTYTRYRIQTALCDGLSHSALFGCCHKLRSRPTQLRCTHCEVCVPSWGGNVRYMSIVDCLSHPPTILTTYSLRGKTAWYLIIMLILLQSHDQHVLGTLLHTFLTHMRY